LSYLIHLKRATFNKDIRWVIKTTKEGRIKEVKQLFNPAEYKRHNPNNRTLLTRNQLIKLLEKEKETKK
tara:strand:- start:102 stop:308 length:207 start_codon:yes stop_codon:yes gene_type:complete